jgi:hypothetical protein
MRRYKQLVVFPVACICASRDLPAREARVGGTRLQQLLVILGDLSGLCAIVVTSC